MVQKDLMRPPSQQLEQETECGELREEEGILLERNKSQLIQYAIPDTQRRRGRRCYYYLHRSVIFSGDRVTTGSTDRVITSV